MASSPLRARGVLPACALLALVALVAFAPATKADDDYGKKGYDAYKECKYKYKGDDCYSPEAKDKCVKAYCDYDSYGKKLYCKPSEKSYCETYDKCKPAKCEYGKCKYYPVVCKSDNPCKESKCKDGYCVEYNKPDYTKCDDDYKNKCVDKKCKDGYCVEEKKKCDDYDYYKYDKECVKKEAYCDEYKGCVKAEYYEDGYECDKDYNKCTIEKCYKGKCKKVGDKKCKDEDRYKYDDECVKKWAYCDKDYGCKETELYGEGYKCYKYYGKKKYNGYCNKWGKCEIDRKDKKDDKYDDDKKYKKKDY